MLVEIFISLVLFILRTRALFDDADRIKMELNWKSSSDRIQALPGLEEMPAFAMFSGYLTISPSKALHYWLNECEDASSNKLIIWFNGGPGCSSMDGNFDEHGPFMFNKRTGRLEKNPYSWNRLAHTLYVESPAGVGFSYDDGGIHEMDDGLVAQENLEALNNFFDKFPTYRNYELYITGESYGGVYVPTLVNAMIAANSWMIPNIKALAIGNGLLNELINERSLIYYAYYHGLFGTQMWKDLNRYCCNEVETCSFDSPTEDCLLKLSTVHQITVNDGLNFYNLYAQCTSESQEAMLRHLHRSRSHPFFSTVLTMNKDMEMRKLTLVPICVNASFLTDYLNSPEVKRAIHVREYIQWQICSEEIFTNYIKTTRDTSQPIKKILHSLDDVRILLYFGDFDMACNFMGGEWFVDQLGYEILTPRRKWMITAEDGSTQIAGFYKEYDRLIYAQIKGAGHMVPVDKPRETFMMMERFLDDRPL